MDKFKKVVIDTGLAEPTNVRVDYKRGFVFINKVRAAERKMTDGSERVIADPDKLREAGLDVDASKLHDAVDELMQE